VANIDKLKDHLRVARTVIDERHLYTIWDNIPKGDDPDFKGDSFGEAVRQGLYFKTYDDWSATLEDLFFANNLDFLKFKGKTLSGDRRKVSMQPAAVFVRQVKELERMFESPNVFDSYKTSTKQAASWPAVMFEDDTVSQGARRHKFSQPEYPKIITKLWKNRRIESPTGTELVAGKPISRASLNKAAGIKDHERFVDLVTGIRKAMKSKGISLTVAYPDKVQLVVKQNRP